MSESEARMYLALEVLVVLVVLGFIAGVFATIYSRITKKELPDNFYGYFGIIGLAVYFNLDKFFV